MKPLSLLLIALSLSVMMLGGCSKKTEPNVDNSVTTPAPVATPAPEAPKAAAEPVKEEAGGWVPPPANVAPAAPAESSAAPAPADAAPMPEPTEAK